MSTLYAILTAWFVLSLPFGIIAGKSLKRLNEREEAVRRVRILS